MKMKRIGLWATGIGVLISVGLFTVEHGYTEEKEHAKTCTLATLSNPTFPRFRVACGAMIPLGRIRQRASRTVCRAGSRTSQLTCTEAVKHAALPASERTFAVVRVPI
jgi:hypothetical protein